MTSTKSPDLNLARDLDRVPELLPGDRLKTVQEFAARNELSEAILARELGETGIVLVAFAIASSEHPEVLSGAQEALGPKIAALLEHVQKHAPSLIEHPRLREMAERFVKARADQKAEDEPSPLFDDVGGIRGIPVFIGRNTDLTPLMRLEILRTNGTILTTVTLRLGDLAFLSGGLLGGLEDSLETIQRLNKCGMLDKDELTGLGKQVEYVSKRIESLKAQLVSEVQEGAAKTSS